MSETDIYKQREQASNVQKSKPKRRRRRTSSRKFDEHDRSKNARRSNNTGFRRLRHVFKKPHVQKRIYTFLGFVLVVLIVFVAVWEFWYQDHRAQKELDRKEKERIERSAKSTQE